ncbi:glycoside hydrolase family 19 protein [Streptomyces griseoviridis]|uniref:Glycoside hydrolase family 19 protein n=1 Tax=Streptomyces hintoniae TaxID=3075521 RepID=A0ABU2UH04_9ACTN|nr:glycoside hydrolase family 19 protein [Streptomyces sp. DSM 41014]MDT0472425.1 glycoside hydrolase family 19 protein [Streptomyces sp. DSM 41014]
MSTPRFRRIRPRRLAVAAVLTALLTALLNVTPASAADGQISGLAGKCVDVAAANNANGTAVQLYDCNGTAAQIWSNPGDGTLRALGKCLDVVDRGTGDGAAVQLWDCSGGSNQQWVVTAARDIVNPAADKCLDVRDNNSANGTRLQIWTCSGTANQKWNAPASGGGGGTPSGFVVSEAQFNQMFPGRNSFYTYSGLTAALSAYPGFATTGGDTVKKQEAAAFLANVNHETGGLVYIVEQNTANYPHYCDPGQPYGCPAGQAAYYGRGPIQLSWNFNYKAAGDALGIDLLNNPWQVENNASVAWKTGLWYWNTQSGPGTMTPHNAMVNGAGFGQTIRSINGSLECDGRNPAQVQSRVDAYQRFAQILGVTPGANLYC